MTKEEAIDIFDDNFTVIDTHGHYTDEEVEQARQMAMRALKQEPCEDAISRKAVLDMTTVIRTSDYSRVIEVVDIDDVKALPSVKPQEPFDIETYCREHFCVMVDKDVWEKAEKALKQEPMLDKIRAEIMMKDGLEEALEIIDKYRGESDCRECKSEHDCYECKKYAESEES